MRKTTKTFAFTAALACLNVTSQAIADKDETGACTGLEKDITHHATELNDLKTKDIDVIKDHAENLQKSADLTGEMADIFDDLADVLGKDHPEAAKHLKKMAHKNREKEKLMNANVQNKNKNAALRTKMASKSLEQSGFRTKHPNCEMTTHIKSRH
ncbi:MAG: hypothetical protein HON43_02765 [Alphaproteobacteria bacterium]|jgi:hypothetical protein|nr:hypothetical protein [Alphaproteobacteria bacterium]MBT5390385.1 hypothetical protein [Alphaproteobacteria bacterium]MBT5540108.1 hypothetical protein [Alphaproteobacteria bacterium]